MRATNTEPSLGTSALRILVTGASRGLGAALAETAAARGHRVYLAARDAEQLRRRAESIGSRYGVAAGWMAIDLRDATSPARLAAAAEGFLGGIDVLVNNAGSGIFRPLVDWSEADIRDVVALNLVAPMLLARAVVAGMMARGSGHIVDVASDLARRPLAQMAPYVATKAGLLGFGQSMHREVRDRGVRVTTVMPGILDSAFNGAQEGTKDPRWALPTADVAARIVDLLELPPHLTVDELVIHPPCGDY